MVSAYLPETLDELRDVVRNGVLREGHTLDFKRELAAGPKANRELAKDLAAFANDGGALIIGVDEPEDGAATVVPVALRGLKERVDQVARGALSPPLHVRCRELRDEADPDHGCLIVVVPPSDRAPHQAAERFWGRGDTTNHVLTPQEVERLYERRLRRQSSITELLQAEIARDPVPADARSSGHVFAVAEPLAGDEDLFVRSLGDERFSSWFHTTLRPRCRRSTWAPDIDSATYISPRAGGWGMHSHDISPERGTRPNGNHPPQERYMFDLEVLDGGGVRAFCGRATEQVESSTVIIFERCIAGTALRVIETAGAVADLTGFFGSWNVGVAATNLRGAISYEASRNWLGSATGYSAEEFVRTASASYDELIEIEDLLGRLVQPLLRSLGSPFDLSDL